MRDRESQCKRKQEKISERERDFVIVCERVRHRDRRRCINSERERQRKLEKRKLLKRASFICEVGHVCVT